MMSVNLHLRTSAEAKIVATPSGDHWIIIEDKNGDARFDDFCLFLPRGVPGESIKTIVDSVNDALDTVRPAKQEAA